MFDGRDQPNIETLATSSLVELLVFRVGEMSVSTSKKSLANSALLGRVTCIKRRDLPLQFTDSMPAYMCMGAKDTPPSTPPGGVGSDLDWEIPKDHVVQRTKA